MKPARELPLLPTVISLALNLQRRLRALVKTIHPLSARDSRSLLFLRSRLPRFFCPLPVLDHCLAFCDRAGFAVYRRAAFKLAAAWTRDLIRLRKLAISTDRGRRARPHFQPACSCFRLCSRAPELPPGGGGGARITFSREALILLCGTLGASFSSVRAHAIAVGIERPRSTTFKFVARLMKNLRRGSGQNDSHRMVLIFEPCDLTSAHLSKLYVCFFFLLPRTARNHTKPHEQAIFTSRIFRDRFIA